MKIGIDLRSLLCGLFFGGIAGIFSLESARAQPASHSGVRTNNASATEDTPKLCPTGNELNIEKILDSLRSEKTAMVSFLRQNGHRFANESGTTQYLVKVLPSALSEKLEEANEANAKQKSNLQRARATIKQSTQDYGSEEEFNKFTSSRQAFADNLFLANCAADKSSDQSGEIKSLKSWAESTLVQEETLEVADLKVKDAGIVNVKVGVGPRAIDKLATLRACREKYTPLCNLLAKIYSKGSWQYGENRRITAEHNLHVVNEYVVHFTNESKPFAKSALVDGIATAGSAGPTSTLEQLEHMVGALEIVDQPVFEPKFMPGRFTTGDKDDQDLGPTEVKQFLSEKKLIKPSSAIYNSGQ